MQRLEVLYDRKSVRKFKDTKIPREDLLEMIESATEAPSAKHQQPWFFVVVENKELIEKMADIVEESHKKIGDLAKNEKDQKIHMSVIKYYTAFKNAPVVVLVYSKPYDMIEYKILKENNASQETLDMLTSPESTGQSIGAAVENFILSATNMGYGTCYMTGPNHAKKELEEVVGFEKEGYSLMSMISVGIAEDNTPDKPQRKPLEKVYKFID
ncbi:MAG: nitroreductase family protein [Peptostreptococcaceae bacterium]